MLIADVMLLIQRTWCLTALGMRSAMFERRGDGADRTERSSDMDNRENRQRSTRIAALMTSLATFATACTFTTSRGASSAAGGTAATQDVNLVADPQFHNIYGGLIRTQSALTDSLVRVAIRPAVLNLLEPLVFETFLGAMRSRSRSPVYLLLGDGANIACASEFHELRNSFARVLGPTETWLMAHGNHDSYMSGTANDWGPAEHETEQFLKRIDAKEFAFPTTFDHPELFAWRDAASARAKAYDEASNRRSWEAACAVPSSLAHAELGVPANKLVWLASYFRYLQANGVAFRTDGTPKYGPEETCQHFTAEAAPTSPLGGRHYSASGCWVSPRRGDNGYENTAYFTNTWMSFVVQRVQLGSKLWALIADTSVSDQETTRFSIGKAGSNGRLGEMQLTELKAHTEQIASADPGARVLIAAHFDADGIMSGEMHKLMRTLRSVHGVLVDTLVSGHTHDPAHFMDHDHYVEYNIGSTVDWPLQSVVMRAASRAADDDIEIINLAREKVAPARGYPTEPTYSRLRLSSARGAPTFREIEYRAAGRLGRTPLRFTQACAHAQSLIALDQWVQNRGGTFREKQDYGDCSQAQQDDLLAKLQSVAPSQACEAKDLEKLERVACHTAALQTTLLNAARADGTLRRSLLLLAHDASYSEVFNLNCKGLLPRQREAQGCKKGWK